DHVSPVMWNNKLYVFWLTFQKTKKNVDEQALNENAKAARFRQGWCDILTGLNSNNTLINDVNQDAFTVWKVTLNWTQLQNGKWQSQEMCKDIMELDINKFQINKANKESYTTAEAQAAIALLTSKNTIKIDEFFKNRIYLYTPFE